MSHKIDKDKEEKQVFEGIISRVYKELSHITLIKTKISTDYKRIFYIDGLEEEFSIERKIPNNYDEVPKEELKIRKGIDILFKYTFSYGDEILATWDMNDKQFSQRIITHIRKKYKFFSYRNSNSYKKFIKTIEATTGENIEIIPDNLILNSKSLVKIKLTEAMDLSYSISQKKSYIIFNMEPNEEHKYSYEFDTQNDLFKYLENYCSNKSSKMVSVE